MLDSIVFKSTHEWGTSDHEWPRGTSDHEWQRVRIEFAKTQYFYYNDIIKIKTLLPEIEHLWRLNNEKRTWNFVYFPQGRVLDKVGPAGIV